MAMIKCLECGKEISDQADRCVNCGCPVPHDGVLTVFFSNVYLTLFTSNFFVSIRFNGQEVRLKKGESYSFAVPNDGGVYNGRISCGILHSTDCSFDFSLASGQSCKFVVDYDDSKLLKTNKWRCLKYTM